LGSDEAAGFVSVDGAVAEEDEDPEEESFFDLESDFDSLDLSAFSDASDFSDFSPLLPPGPLVFLA
jgi:hypothetical protein